MPGLLIMNSNGADARDGENRKRTYEGKLVNGERTTWKDAGNTNASADTNGAVASIAGSAALSPEHLAELPPELVHVTAEFYHPLGKLIERVSQETFNGLNDTLRKMSDIAVQQQANGVLPNGMGGHASSAPDNSEANIKKKMLLMNFAKDTRAKFIKLLVLVDWGKRSADDISNVIDLFSWTKDQTSALNRVDVQMEWIKMLTAHARKNNPDIRTALEILSKGKAEWIPDVSSLTLIN
jgi:mediator of RNA polymerase II transcription subunit 14